MSAGVYARTDPERGTTVLDRKLHRKLDPKLVRSLAVGAILAMGVAFGAAPANAVYQPGEPPNIDPGTPVFAGSATPVPAEPAAQDPTKNTLRSIYDADVAAGGTSYWFDRILARPFLSNSDSTLMTRGRAL